MVSIPSSLHLKCLDCRREAVWSIYFLYARPAAQNFGWKVFMPWVSWTKFGIFFLKCTHLKKNQRKYLQNCKYFLWFSLNLTEFSNMFCQSIKIELKQAIFFLQSYKNFSVKSRILQKFFENTRKVRIICRSAAPDSCGKRIFSS